jgi:hypothetical protein
MPRQGLHAMSHPSRPPVTPGVERLRTGACGVVVVVVSGGVTGLEMGREIC